MSIELIRLNKKSPDYKSVKRLYKSAFPTDEKAPFGLLMRKSKKDNVDFWAAYSGDKWVGLAYVLSYKDISYLFYLAIDDKARGNGFGSGVLGALKEKYKGRNLFLAIEEIDEKAENYSERINRKKFYEKNGFHDLNCKLREASVVYDLLGLGDKIKPKDYADMFDEYLGKMFRRFVKMEILD